LHAVQFHSLGSAQTNPGGSRIFLTSIWSAADKPRATADSSRPPRAAKVSLMEQGGGRFTTGPLLCACGSILTRGPLEVRPGAFEVLPP
jgi:hypothetical protein